MWVCGSTTSSYATKQRGAFATNRRNTSPASGHDPKYTVPGLECRLVFLTASVTDQLRGALRKQLTGGLFSQGLGMLKVTRTQKV